MTMADAICSPVRASPGAGAEACSASFLPSAADFRVLSLPSLSDTAAEVDGTMANPVAAARAAVATGH